MRIGGLTGCVYVAACEMHGRRPAISPAVTADAGEAPHDAVPWMVGAGSFLTHEGRHRGALRYERGHNEAGSLCPANAGNFRPWQLHPET
jgi:hypothetical protein